MKRFFASDAESDMLIAEATKTFGLKIGDIINMAIKNQFLPITEPFRTEARFILQRHTEGALEAQEIKQSMTRGIRALGTRPVRDADRLQGFFARYHLHEDVENCTITENDALWESAVEVYNNHDIDPKRLERDYILSPDRGMTEYDYFLQRKSELYCYNRNDVKVMVGWIVTAPQDLDPERYDNFFYATYNFLANRYGEENVVQAIVHDDEGGQPHLHFCFVPVVEDPKHEQGYKICANDVLDRRELRNFHPDLQRYLNEHGLEDACVMTGVTKRQGGNRTVAQLKAERKYQQEVERPALYFGESKIEQGLHF